MKPLHDPIPEIIHGALIGIRPTPCVITRKNVQRLSTEIATLAVFALRFMLLVVA